MDLAIGMFMLIFLVGFAVYLARSYRKGGYGPPIKMSAWSRAGRLRTNRYYEKHRWAKPYDDEGNMLPRSQRTLPDDANS